MDAKQTIIAKDTINNGFKLLVSELNENKIMDEILDTQNIEEQKNIIKKYVSNLDNLDTDTMIELSEVMLYMVEKTTLQKSFMLGRLNENNDIVRTKDGLKVISKKKNSYITIPYSKITNEIIGKELAKQIRKVF